MKALNGNRAEDTETWTLRILVGEVLEVAPERIGEDFGPDHAPNWDSLTHLRLVTAVEEQYGVTFTMEEIGEIRSYRDLEVALRRNL